MPSTITWENRGDDNFGAFGANAAAARRAVDAAINSWQEVVRDFNFGSGNDLFTLQISAVPDLPDDHLAEASDTLVIGGRPRGATVSVDTSSAWYFDPTPHKHNEFGTGLNKYAAQKAPAGTYDLYSVMVHEIGHALGVGSDPALDLWSSGFLSDTGIPDPLEAGHTLWAYDSPQTKATFSVSAEMSPHLYGGPPQSGQPGPSHPHDSLIPRIPADTRRVISGVDAAILAEVYDYVIATPPGIGAAAPLTHLNPGTGVLTVTGDQADNPDDDIIIWRSGGNTLVGVNGATFSYSIASVWGGIVVRGRSGADDINVDLSGGAVTGAGKSVTVDGGGQSDRLSVRGAGDWTVEVGGLKRGVTKVVGYESVEHLELATGGGDDIVTVVGTPKSVEDLTVFAEAGDDTISVRGSSGRTVVNAWGGADDDTINVGSLANTLDDVSDVTVYGGTGYDTLNVRNQGTSAGMSYQLYADHLHHIHGDVYFTGTLEVAGVSGGGGTDEFRVYGIPAVTQVTLDGNSDFDTLIGPDAPTTWNVTDTDAGNINGKVWFTFMNRLTGGNAADTFKFDDGTGVSGKVDGGGGEDQLNYSNHAGGATVNLKTMTATGTGGIVSVESVYGGTGADAVVGRDTSNTWRLTGPKDGSVKWWVGGTPHTFTFSAVENLAGGAHIDSLVGANTPNTWNLTAANAGNRNDLLYFTSVEQMSGGTNNDVFSFSDGVTLSGNINGGGGSFDLVSYLPCYNPVTIELNKFLNIDQVFGGGGSDTLYGPAGTNTWNLGSTNTGSVNNAISFGWIENIQCASGADRIVFGNGGGLTGFIHGGGGTDTLDYSAHAAANPVTVHLLDQTATGAPGGVTGIENVTGGKGNDTLTGNQSDNILRGQGGQDVLNGGGGHDILLGGADNDTLDGGLGRDLLFGGLGADQLTGGGDDDLLFGGGSFWDGSDWQLTIMRDLWTTPDLNDQAAYESRIDQVRDAFFFEDYTVTDDNPGDVLTGGGGLDWFWADPNEVTDLADGEVVNW